VFRAIFAARRKCFKISGVFFTRLASRPRPLDRPGLNLALLKTQESFRGSAGDSKIAQIIITAEWSRVLSTKPGVEVCRRRVGRVKKTLSQVYLKAITGRDVIDDSADRL